MMHLNEREFARSSMTYSIPRLDTHMPTLNDDDAAPSFALENDPLAAQDADVDEADAPDGSPSEVAMRISLLGKLIIPPPAP